MSLQADDIRKILINEYGFQPILQNNGSEYKRLYKLHHEKLDHLLHIDRRLKNHKILAIPLKYHTYKEALNDIVGVDEGGISHHQGYSEFWDHIGTNPYEPESQIEPPAQHYGFSTIKSLKSFMDILLTSAQERVVKYIEEVFPEDVDDSFDETISPTEKDAVIKARIGQGTYRRALLNFWGRCAVTGCTIETMLVSSHIKPWSVDKEARLDPFNGLLLSPTLDRAFDQRLISFNDDGSIILSPALTKTDLELLHLNSNLKLRKVDKRHLPYLAWHRANIVKE